MVLGITRAGLGRYGVILHASKPIPDSGGRILRYNNNVLPNFQYDQLQIFEYFGD